MALMDESTSRLVFRILLAFLLLNILLPGELHSLTLTISQVVVFGLAALYLLFLRPPAPAPRWLPLAVLFVAALAVSQLASWHPHHSLQVGVQIASMVVLAWMVSEIGPREGDVWTGAVVLLVLAVALSLYGLSQIFTFFSQPPEAELVRRVLPVSEHYLRQIYSQQRIFSTFILPTSFSAFLSIVFPIGVALAVRHRRNRVALAAIVAGLLVILAALVQAKSHGGPVALAAAIVIALMLIFRRRGWLMLSAPAAALAVGVVLLLVIGALRGDYLWDLAAENSPIRLRGNLWLAGLAAWSRHWLLGIGAGNFSVSLYPFLSSSVRPAQHLHNTYLQLPIELGLLGLALVAATVCMLARRLLETTDEWRAARDPLRLGLIVAVLTFLVVNAVEIVLYFHSLGLLGAFLIGLWLRRTEPLAADGRSTSAGRAGWMARVALAAAFAIAVVLLGRWFLADHFFEKAKREQLELALSELQGHTLGAGPRDPAQGAMGIASARRGDSCEQIRRMTGVAIAIDDGNYEYHSLHGDSLRCLAVLRRDIALLAAAQRAYSSAIERFRHAPYLHYRSGELLWIQHRLLSANRNLSEAALLHPTESGYATLLGELRSEIVRRFGDDRLEAVR